MAKKEPKEKEQRFVKNKYLTDTEVLDTQRLSNQELLKEYLVQNKAIRVVQQRKREDTELNSLKKEIKHHRDTSADQKTQDEITQLKARLKEIKLEIDEGIKDLLDQMKQRNLDFKEDMSYAKEKLKLIQMLLDKRNI